MRVESLLSVSRRSVFKITIMDLFNLCERPVLILSNFVSEEIES